MGLPFLSTNIKCKGKDSTQERRYAEEGNLPTKTKANNWNRTSVSLFQTRKLLILSSFTTILSIEYSIVTFRP